MKSYINTLADYRKAPFEKEIVISCPQKHIEAQMKHLTRAYKKTQSVQTVENGDVTVLSLKSEIEKFNKPTVFVTVGGGLFNTELEKKLIGHSVGEPFSITVNGTAVKVTIKQASRTIFPEPTDEMAVKYAQDHEEFSEITTVDEYRERIEKDYIEEKKESCYYKAMDQVLNYVLTHSDWVFDEKELEACVNEEKYFINQELKEEGIDTDYTELSDDEISHHFDVSSLKELEQMISDGVEQRIAMALWVSAINGVDTKNIPLDALDGDWSFLENYVKEALTVTEE